MIILWLVGKLDRFVSGPYFSYLIDLLFLALCVGMVWAVVYGGPAK